MRLMLVAAAFNYVIMSAVPGMIEGLKDDDLDV
jgi:hypothetical protein